MTVKEFYNKCVLQLAFTDDAEFDVLCLFESFLNIKKQDIILNSVTLSSEQTETIEAAVGQRIKRVPLQYIIGQWDFYDMTFIVGEGVLIPRPETEALVDFALEKIKDINKPVVYDLCSGSGCIGLTIAKHRPDATVYLFEKEDAAFEFLLKNKEKYNLDNAIAVKADVFNYEFNELPMADMILSNPPYIPAREIPQLQDEVHFEPVSALDGGKDGLDFYRCIYNRWLTKLKSKGYIALECGDGQSKEIFSIFNEENIQKHIIYDFNNIDRFVIFRI